MIEKMELDTDEDGYYLVITGDFVDEADRYLRTEDTSFMRLKLDNHEMIRFAKRVQQTDDWFYLAHRIKA